MEREERCKRHLADVATRSPDDTRTKRQKVCCDQQVRSCVRCDYWCVMAAYACHRCNIANGHLLPLNSSHLLHCCMSLALPGLFSPCWGVRMWNSSPHNNGRTMLLPSLSSVRGWCRRSHTQESVLGGLCRSLWICILSRSLTGPPQILHVPRARWVAAYSLPVVSRHGGLLKQLK